MQLSETVVLNIYEVSVETGQTHALLTAAKVI